MTTSFKQKVLQFWKAFEDEETTIREMMDRKVDGNILVSFTKSILQIAFNDVQFLIGVDVHNKYELTLSPQGDRVKLIQYNYWLKHAPASLLNSWTFHASKPAIKNTKYKIEMFGVTLEDKDLILYPEINEETSRINLDVFCPKLDSLVESQRYSLFFIFLDQYISELYTIEHISNIQFIYNELDKKQVQIGSLKRFIDETIQKNGWTQSPNPLDAYLGYKVKPSSNPNWILRDDIAAGYSSCTAPISAYHFKDSSFFNSYKDDGIIFGFLFFENLDIADDYVVSFRASIEDKIIEQTSQHSIADCFGGATGFHFSYIDVIIYDYDAFIKIAKNIISTYNFEEAGFSYFLSGSTPIMLADISV